MRRLLLPLLGCALLLGGCSGASRNAPPLGDLKLPGVAKIASVADLEQRTGSHNISEVIPYRNMHDDQMHVIFQSQHAYYDATLDGSGLVPVTTICTEDFAITSDGHWGICVIDQGKNLAIHDFTGHSADHIISVDTGTMNYPPNLSWAPDNRRLALMSGLGGGCSIAIYDTIPPYTRLTLMAVLAFPTFVLNSPTGSRCAIGGLSWSPDGKWLAFSASDPYGHYVLSISSLGFDTATSHSLPITKVIGVSQLVRLNLGGYIRGLSWSNKANVVMFVGNYGRGVEEKNWVTGQQTEILTQQVAEILNFAWTPDGKRLVFVLGLPVGEIIPPTPQMYVYTPSAV